MRNFIPISVSIVFLLFISVPNASANWFYQNTFSASAEGDDNKRLLVDEDEGVVGVELRTSGRLIRRTETSFMRFQGDWRSSRFDGDAADSNLDTDKHRPHTVR